MTSHLVSPVPCPHFDRESHLDDHPDEPPDKLYLPIALRFVVRKYHGCENGSVVWPRSGSESLR